jgi:hypothetical protein
MRLPELARSVNSRGASGISELTQATAEAFNELQDEFFEAGSEIETAAREAIGGDVAFILEAYGYDVDIEEAIGNRDW